MKIFSCEVKKTVVAAVWMVLCEVGGGTIVGDICGCLGLLSLSAPVKQLVWYSCLQLQQWFFDWHC